jgi:hypothetical protein
MRYEFQYPGRWPIMLMFYRVTEFFGRTEESGFRADFMGAANRLRDYDFLEGDAEFLAVC